MKNQSARYKVFTLSLVFAILTVATLIPWTNSVLATGLVRDPRTFYEHQILPTETPQPIRGEEILITNPALLRIMILLSVVAVLVIFWGVWINRHKLNLR